MSEVQAVQPLDGILVADFSRVLAGPLATMTLADLGARVVKVERPGTGDDTRQWAPPASATGSTYFDSVNRGKESVALDLRDPGDLALARELALRADVLIENLLPGTMSRLGLDPDELCAANPRLVWCSVNGWGSAGGARMAGYDFIAQAASGLMHITGEAGGEAMKVGVALVDVLTGKDAVIGILAALRERDVTGRGARIEVSLLSSAQAALANQAQAVLGAEAQPTRMGNAHPSIAPYEPLACADGMLAVAIGNDAQFAKLLAALELEPDARFATNAQRVAHRAELVEMLEARMRSAPAEHWERALVARGLAASRVRTIGEGIALAQALGLEPTFLTTGAAGSTTQLRPPVRWVPDRAPTATAPPLLGEHDAAVRAWLATPSDPDHESERP